MRRSRVSAAVAITILLGVCAYGAIRLVANLDVYTRTIQTMGLFEAIDVSASRQQLPMVERYSRCLPKALGNDALKVPDSEAFLALLEPHRSAVLALTDTIVSRLETDGSERVSVFPEVQPVEAGSYVLKFLPPLVPVIRTASNIAVLARLARLDGRGQDSVDLVAAVFIVEGQFYKSTTGLGFVDLVDVSFLSALSSKGISELADLAVDENLPPGTFFRLKESLEELDRHHGLLGIAAAREQSFVPLSFARMNTFVQKMEGTSAYFDIGRVNRWTKQFYPPAESFALAHRDVRDSLILFHERAQQELPGEGFFAFVESACVGLWDPQCYLGRHLLWFTVHDWCRFHFRQCKARAYLRGAYLALAIRAHAETHGALPTTLDDLSPIVSANMLVDPLSGKSFVYAVNDSSFTLASPGIDKPIQVVPRNGGK